MCFTPFSFLGRLDKQNRNYLSPPCKAAFGSLIGSERQVDGKVIEVSPLNTIVVPAPTLQTHPEKPIREGSLLTAL